MSKLVIGKVHSPNVKIDYNLDASSAGFVPLQPNPEVPPTIIPVQGAGDMFRSVYDTDADGVVDKAEQVLISNIPGLQSTLNNILNQLGQGGGSGGSSAILFVSNSGTETILAGQPVCKVGDVYQSAAAIAPKNTVLGFAAETSLPGEQLKILQEGLITMPPTSWDLITGVVGGLAATMHYYLTPDGKISTLAPSDSPHYLIRLGYALNNTDFLVDLDLSIKL